jgi:hypothetical protein
MLYQYHIMIAPSISQVLITSRKYHFVIKKLQIFFDI